MKTLFTLSISALLLSTGALPVAAEAQDPPKVPKVGGFTKASVSDKSVVAAAEFAVKAQQEAMRKTKGQESTKIELVKIVEAQQQVVAGANYQLQLKVKVDGKEKSAEAVVWWQAWRKPDPYQLTSWTWQ